MSVEEVVEGVGGRNGWGCGRHPDLEMGGASPLHPVPKINWGLRFANP